MSRSGWVATLLVLEPSYSKDSPTPVRILVGTMQSMDGRKGQNDQELGTGNETVGTVGGWRVADAPPAATSHVGRDVDGCASPGGGYGSGIQSGQFCLPWLAEYDWYYPSCRFQSVDTDAGRSYQLQPFDGDHDGDHDGDRHRIQRLPLQCNHGRSQGQGQSRQIKEKCQRKHDHDDNGRCPSTGPLRQPCSHVPSIQTVTARSPEQPPTDPWLGPDGVGAAVRGDDSTERASSPFPLRLVGIVESMVRTDDAKDVLAVIGLCEDGDEDCNNALIDFESGLNPATVDEVLDYLWKSDQIEGIMTPGGRNPSLVGILRVLPDKERQWGDDGGIGIVRKVQGVLGSRHTDSFDVGPRLVREKSAKQSRTVNHGQR